MRAPWKLLYPSWVESGPPLILPGTAAVGHFTTLRRRDSTLFLDPTNIDLKWLRGACFQHFTRFLIDDIRGISGYKLTSGCAVKHDPTPTNIFRAGNFE